LNPHAPGSGSNPARNFATVGDEYFCKHKEDFLERRARSGGVLHPKQTKLGIRDRGIARGAEA
jgi:hypothetical protein